MCTCFVWKVDLGGLGDGVDWLGANMWGVEGGGIRIRDLR